MKTEFVLFYPTDTGWAFMCHFSTNVTEKSISENETENSESQLSEMKMHRFEVFQTR